MGCHGSKNSTEIVITSVRPAPPPEKLGGQADANGVSSSRPPTDSQPLKLTVDDWDMAEQPSIDPCDDELLQARRRGSLEGMNDRISSKTRLKGNWQSESTINNRMGTKTGYNLIKKISARNVGTDYELLVLGAGPAGVRAALEAAGRGVRVGLIDMKAAIANVPTGAHSKCLREAVLAGAKSWDDVEEVLDRAIKQAVAHTSRQLRTFCVEVLTGRGKLQGQKRVLFTPVNGDAPRSLSFECLVIATGSIANRFPPVDFGIPGVFDSDTIQAHRGIPKKMVVQGAGIIGLEYALIFKKLGVENVTVVDIFDKVVPMLDVSLQEACKAVMRKQGVQFIMNTKFEKVERGPTSTDEHPQVLITLQGGQVLDCDCLLSACGRSGATDDLGLEHFEPVGLKLGRGKFIQANDRGNTGVPGVYAVGDCAGGNLATVGQAMATRAIREYYGSGMVMNEADSVCKPFGVWTIPEIAWAGINEEQACRDKIPHGTVKVNFSRTTRGCVSQEKGFLKLVYHAETGLVLGVHLCGDGACDLVNFGAEAVSNGDTVYDLLQFVFPAVTYHELYHLAAAEAKLRIMHKGATSLEAACAWQKVQHALEKAVKEEGKSVKEILTSAFKYFDEDSSGYITPDQLDKALQGLGMHFDNKQVRSMVQEATGSEKDQQIDYQHFLRIFNCDKQEPGTCGCPDPNA